MMTEPLTKEEREALREVADAMGAEHMLRLLRTIDALEQERDSARNERDNLRECWDTTCAHVAEACEILGADVSVSTGQPPDTWTLREHCTRVVRERDAAVVAQVHYEAKADQAANDVAEAAAAERARIVAMLRASAAREGNLYVRWALEAKAGLIERGEHEENGA